MRLRAWLHRLTAPKPTNRQLERAEMTQRLCDWLRTQGADSLRVELSYLGPLGGESDRIQFMLNGQRYMISTYLSGYYPREG